MARISTGLALFLTSAAALLALGCGGPGGLTPITSAPNRVVLANPLAKKGADSLPGSYLVAFRPDLRGQELLHFKNFAAEHQTHFGLLQERFLADPRVKDIQFLTAINLSAVDHRGKSAKGGAYFSPTFGLRGFGALDDTGSGALPVATIARVDFAGENAARGALAEWDASGRLWFAEPNYISRTSTAPNEPVPEKPANIFTDHAEHYATLDHWWLKSVNIVEALQTIAARDITQPGVPTDDQIVASGPIVAVLDSGVDFEHPALKDRIWKNPDQNAADCDNDLHGCNTTIAVRGKLGDGNVYPFATTGPGQDCGGKDGNCSHGTHVAGLIAADATWVDPSTGDSVGGTCPVCQIMILKIVSQIGSESGILDSAIVAAIKYVALFRRDNGSAVRVVNASFGKFVRSRTVDLMIRLMKDDRGTILIGAAGNEDTLTMEYPAAFDDAVAVSAVDSRLRKVQFSNFGHWVDVAAPGSGLRSTVPGESLDTKSGTSMATPVVAGIAGLMVARYPNISFGELRHWLINSADPAIYGRDSGDGFNYNNYYVKIAGEETREPLLGAGLVNANAAVSLHASEALPLYTNLDRVRPGCSAIGAEINASRAARFWGLIALLCGLSVPTFFWRRARDH